MKDIVGHIFWTDEDGDRARADLSGTPPLSKQIQQISRSQPIDEIRHQISRILKAQIEPTVIDPDTLQHIGMLLDPYQSHKPGPPQNPVYSHIAKVWVELWKQYRRQGYKKTGLMAVIDDKMINAGIAPKALRKAREQHKAWIKQAKSE